MGSKGILLLVKNSMQLNLMRPNTSVANKETFFFFFTATWINESNIIKWVYHFLWSIYHCLLIYSLCIFESNILPELFLYATIAHSLIKENQIWESHLSNVPAMTPYYLNTNRFHPHKGNNKNISKLKTRKQRYCKDKNRVFVCLISLCAAKSSLFGLFR